jgi:hypothetical protein
VINCHEYKLDWASGTPSSWLVFNTYDELLGRFCMDDLEDRIKFAAVFGLDEADEICDWLRNCPIFIRTGMSNGKN